MSETALGTAAGSPLARSPVRPAEPVSVVAGWEVSGRRSVAPLRLEDCTPLAKVSVRAGSDIAAALGGRPGRAVRDRAGRLVVGAGPGEWLLLAGPGRAADLLGHADVPADDFVTAVDVTHGRALLRLTGPDAPALLAKVCAIDLDDRVTPDGSAFRSSVAKVATDVVRDDRGGPPSYLLHCERSLGQYLFDALLDAGAEYGVEVDGFSEGTT